MSFLDLLNDSQDLSDHELLHIVEKIEQDISDAELVSIVEDTEKIYFNKLLDWGSDTDSQILSAVHDLESCKTFIDSEKTMEENLWDVTDAELLCDVKRIESSLDHLLGTPPQREQLNTVSQYQGPAVLMLTMKNNVVFIHKVNKVQCKPSFDLVFFSQDDDDSSAGQYLSYQKEMDALQIIDRAKHHVSTACNYHKP